MLGLVPYIHSLFFLLLLTPTARPDIPQLSMPPSFRNPIVAGIVAAFFFLLTTLHVFVASNTSSLAASLVGTEGVRHTVSRACALILRT